MIGAPLNFNLSMNGVAVTGETSSPEELRKFAQRLLELADTMAILLPQQDKKPT